MGFFKDFKDDFSQALNEMLPGDDFTEDDEIQVNTLGSELDVEQELSKLDGLLEQVEKKSSRPVAAAVSQPQPELQPLDELEADMPEEQRNVQETETVTDAVTEPPVAVQSGTAESFAEPEQEQMMAQVQADQNMGEPAEIKPVGEPEPQVKAGASPVGEPNVQAEPDPVGKPEPQVQDELGIQEEMKPEHQVPYVHEVAAADGSRQIKAGNNHTEIKDTIKEEKIMDTMNITDTTATAAAAETAAVDAQTTAPAPEPVPAPAPAPAAVSVEVSDEVSVITAGTKIKGNMEATGSFEIEGRIEGDIKCNGKLTVIGSVIGNSESAEFFADAAHVEGEVVSSGTVKIGLGSVIIGNISATSAVVAGAVKGDIDVQGPVVVDTSAVIMGNIKSRSVQINNGAVIEGFCSQCYSDVDVESLFAKK